MNTLSDYYFAHPQMFVIPIEHLSPTGIAATFQPLLRERAGVTPEWIVLFNEAFATYWQRAAELAARAPQYCFPPRLQHACIVPDAVRVRPYFQPFNRCAWLLYASDFDPGTSNREFATYQFLHAERMGLLQEVTETVVRNLAYWLLRSDEEAEQFRAACGQTPRPDAAAFRALAEAMSWVRRLHHEALKPPVLMPLDPYVSVPHTGLLMPQGLQPQLDDLVRRWRRSAEAAMAAFYEAHARRGRDRAGDLCTWVRERQPYLLITGKQGEILWDREAPEELRALRRALGGIGESAANSIRADLEVIADRSRRFMDSLTRPEVLPLPHADTAQFGLSYLHLTRKLIAYNLQEPGMERLRVPAPPYERFMLGARTIHEWGHLAAHAGWVPVAAGRQRDYEDLHAQLAVLFDEIIRDAPAAVRHHAAEDIARLASTAGGSAGRALTQFVVKRFPDFQANLLARCYLTIGERETYIRNNVYSLALEYPSTALFQRLARYAYEYQYLRFSDVADPHTYFLASTWFADEYLQRGVLTENQLSRLLGTVGRLCDCYAVDATRFTAAFPADPKSGGPV